MRGRSYEGVLCNGLSLCCNLDHILCGLPFCCMCHWICMVIQLHYHIVKCSSLLHLVGLQLHGEYTQSMYLFCDCILSHTNLLSLSGYSDVFILVMFLVLVYQNGPDIPMHVHSFWKKKTDKVWHGIRELTSWLGWQKYWQKSCACMGVLQMVLHHSGRGGVSQCTIMASPQHHGSCATLV